MNQPFPKCIFETISARYFLIIGGKVRYLQSNDQSLLQNIQDLVYANFRVDLKERKEIVIGSQRKGNSCYVAAKSSEVVKHKIENGIIINSAT